LSAAEATIAERALQAAEALTESTRAASADLTKCTCA
jgi:hypothetical protein